jgi:hypothetical protein
MTNAPSPRLMPHQERELEFLQQNPRALLLSETGTGSTVPPLQRALDPHTESTAASTRGRFNPVMWTGLQ